MERVRSSRSRFWHWSQHFFPLLSLPPSLPSTNTNAGTRRRMVSNHCLFQLTKHAYFFLVSRYYKALDNPEGQAAIINTIDSADRDRPFDFFAVVEAQGDSPAGNFSSWPASSAALSRMKHVSGQSGYEIIALFYSANNWKLNYSSLGEFEPGRCRLLASICFILVFFSCLALLLRVLFLVCTCNLSCTLVAVFQMLYGTVSVRVQWCTEHVSVRVQWCTGHVCGNLIGVDGRKLFSTNTASQS